MCGSTLRRIERDELREARAGLYASQMGSGGWLGGEDIDATTTRVRELEVSIVVTIQSRIKMNVAEENGRTSIATVIMNPIG